MREVLISLCLFLVSSMMPISAVVPDERLDDPKLEAEAREISKTLRCMVCQNQSIDDSDAALAKDLRLLVRERLLLGESPEQVVDYVTDIYGEYVLLEPRWGLHTLLLWLSPVLLLGGGVLLGRGLFRGPGMVVAGDKQEAESVVGTEALLDELRDQDD